jgi:hypothetical protein
MLRVMQRTPLKSRAVISAGYDAARRELEIEFHNGRIYRYREVPEGVYQFLLRTESKGGYVNRMIQDRYAYEQVGPDAPEQDVLAALQASLDAVESERR